MGLDNDSVAAANEAEASLNTENEYDFNQDVGILMVYAPHRVQREVKRYLDEVLSIVRRQVLLEATVVEVVLNNQYAQGVDWSLFNQFAKKGLALYQGANVGGAAAVLNEVVRSFTNEATRTFTDVNGDGDITAADFNDATYTDRNGASVANPNFGNLANWQAFTNRNSVETADQRVTAFSVAPTVIANPAQTTVGATDHPEKATYGQTIRLVRDIHGHRDGQESDRGACGRASSGDFVGAGGGVYGGLSRQGHFGGSGVAGHFRRCPCAVVSANQRA